MNITTMTGARNTEMFIMTTKNTRKLTTMKMLLKVRNTFYSCQKGHKKIDLHLCIFPMGPSIYYVSNSSYPP